MKDVLECYKILGIEPGSTPERVRHAYLQLSRFYDPARYVEGDPEHRIHAEEKKKEIDEAYGEIRRFLPELQEDHGRLGKAMEQNRDFKEMVREAPTEVSKTLMAVIIGGALLLLFAWAYYIYRQTRILPVAPVPLVDPEAAPSPVPDHPTEPAR
jgi:curved DNA-binding protein CbpA